ncbi:sensor histidine kinase [Tengunoibacter tsumagoiensis]|uniref:histidine kinase n=1 Tax=Tengunoibacter tsumagoiensis TaxID=2014871 RepID=A0A402AA11_9CHLR|nr:ATP-binding protein [Tengunoibacter tsumagoiensis]GCE16003.1 hypothetical protein KTT_58620 [Tengunoibacter tsumagoiensis]
MNTANSEDSPLAASHSSQESSLHEPTVETRLRLAGLMKDVGLALIQSEHLQDMAQRCTEAFVHYFDAAFARIWVLNQATEILELQASSGLYTHLDGPHSRIPVGMFKIGKIAAERKPHLTNAVIGDPRVSDQAWARQEGMVAFAGYPLLVDDQVVGVMAMFARHHLSASVLEAMASTANAVAVGIDRKRWELERLHLLETAEKARADAEREKQRATDILERISDAFFALDRNWIFTYLNKKSEPLLQRRREELLGHNIWEEFPDAVGLSFYTHYHLALEQQININFEEFYPPLNTWFEVHAHPAPDGLSVYFHNINDRKAMEQERERLFQIEQETRSQAQIALAIRNRFLTSISHDLKTPLTTMKVNVQLAQRQLARVPITDPNPLSKRLGAIEGATKKMTGMIEDLLDLARNQTDPAIDHVFQSLDLLPLVHQVVGEFQDTSKRHQILIIDKVDTLPINGNPARMDRVLSNLLSNAIKYSPQGGQIIVESDRQADGETCWGIISIQDQGIGIPHAEIPSIFQPFQRASNVIDSIQGTGIGLASVVQVLEQHGGSISIQSEEGKGSTFTIRLPLLLETAI